MELGAHFAAFMREKYGKRPNFHILNADFETVELEEGSFDLIYSAATIQWIDQDIAYRRCFRLLRPGGTLAMFATAEDYSRDDPALYEAIQEVYRTSFATTEPYTQRFDKLAGERYGFGPCEYREFYGTRTFTAEEYVEYLQTHCTHATIREDCREPFFGGIRRAVEAAGGRITLRDTYPLHLYRKPL